MTSAYPPVRAFFLIGKTLKSHGTSGQLRVRIEDKFNIYLQPGYFIFLELDGSKVPYQISKVDEGQHLVITLKDIAGKQESDMLSGRDIWIPIEQVKTGHLKSPAQLKKKWEDYIIVDLSTHTTYKILRTEEFPQQLMAVVEEKGKEIYIPLHEQLIDSIDQVKKIIEMKIPEGLLDL